MSDGMLRHLAFFEELGKMEETDASWRAVSAGLVTLRLVDQWIAEGPSAARSDSWAVNAVREAIAAMAETTPIKRILTSIVEIVVQSPTVDMHALCPRLMAYSQALEYEAKWSLAADVYSTIVAHAHPVEDADLAVTAHLQLAWCLRTLGDLDGAAHLYADASRIAAASGDLIGILRGRLGDAKIAMARGNLPDAEAIVDDTILRAEGAHLRDIRSKAYGERALIAGLRGQHDNVIRYAYQSLQLSPVQRDRDRSLNNIATAFRHLGLLDVARDAYVVLAATTQEQYVRWIAGLNLMELAAIEGVELVFDRYRRDYESAEFTPQLRVTYLTHVGRGYHALGRSELGIPYLRRAVKLASQHGFNQMMFEAEAALAEAERGAAVRREKAPSHLDGEVQHVIDAIHEWKALAEVS
jgi:tetratricopeptide (TPR) repeat protein